MSTKYTLTVQNDSTQSGDFCIFQQAPDTNVANITTLAWLSKAANPTTNLVFQWDLQYNFIWSNSTNLKPGDTVVTSQSWDCDVNTSNRIVFDFVNNAYNFSNQTQGDYAGNLYIDEGQSVRPNQASVGIGMSGSGTFLVPSQPNMQVMFTPKPTYWLVFGTFKQGDVVDIGQVTKNAKKIVFNGVTDLAVTFKSTNTWLMTS